MGDHRHFIGALWDVVGPLQLNFLKSHGLQPEHKLLDIACGCLRAGVRFIDYLDAGNYHGVDREQWLLDAAISEEIPKYGLRHKRPNLLCNAEFEVGRFGTTFSYAIAQSLFTHLPERYIWDCLKQVKKVLEPDGQFFASILLAKQAKVASHKGRSELDTYPFHYNAYHYPFSFFEPLAEELSMKVEYIGDWDHPRDVKMIKFTHKETE